jgi:hypothetical protein
MALTENSRNKVLNIVHSCAVTVYSFRRWSLAVVIAFLGTAGINCKHEILPPTPTERIPSQITLKADNPSIERLVADISIDSLRSFVETLASFHTRHSISDTTTSDKGIGAARRWIFQKFQSFSQASGGRLEVFYDDFTPTICEVTRLQRNVIARLPGTAIPERQILVSGHYDSRTVGRCDAEGFAPGANDDGSGTAAVLELARIMGRYEFEATLLFVAFTGEEQGLFGSRHYAQVARQRGDNLIAMATNDIIGNVVGGSGAIDSSRVRCFSEDPMDSPHRQQARYLKLQGEAYVPGFTVDMILARDRPGRGGDHFAFYENGFTAVRLTEPEDNLNYQHNGNDLPQFMSFSYFRKVVRVNAAFLASLAWAPPAPNGVTVEKLGPGRYRLKWNASNAGEVTKYLVSLRSAASITYDSLFDAGTGTELILTGITPPALVSVAAVDSDQNESLFSTEVLFE